MAVRDPHKICAGVLLRAWAPILGVGVAQAAKLHGCHALRAMVNTTATHNGTLRCTLPTSSVATNKSRTYHKSATIRSRQCHNRGARIAGQSAIASIAPLNGSKSNGTREIGLPAL